MVITAGPLLGPGFLLRKESGKWGESVPDGLRTFTATGRSALLSCMRQLAIPRDSAILLPAYLCPAVVEPFEKLGMKIVYYPVSRELEPDISCMNSVISSERVGAVLVIHYFGFPVKRLSEIVSLCRKNAVNLIEDCAHALFSRVHGNLLGEKGDCAIFSFRKSLPLPEGGLAVLRHGKASESAQSLSLKWREFFNLAKEAGFWAESLIGFSVRNYLLGSPCFRKWIESRNRMSENIKEEKMGALSYRIFLKVDIMRAVKKRRENYVFLFSRLKDSGAITILSPELSPGICPVGLAILIENRDHWRDCFYRKGYGLRAFWDLLPEEVSAFSDSIWLRDRILILPVHEDLSPKQLNRLVEDFKQI